MTVTLGFWMWTAGFFPWGDWGVPPVGENLVNPPHPALVPIFQPEPVPLHPTFVHENFYNFSIFFFIDFDYF